MLGWEKAENDVATLKQQLEASVQQNLALEVRVSHLDGALKECVRQLSQARDEQEQKLHDAMAEKTIEFEFVKAELDNQLAELKANAKASKSDLAKFAETDILLKLDFLEKENMILKHELLSQCEKLKTKTMEMDLCTLAAETARKQQLESIKKVTKLEAECRRLQVIARKCSSNNDHWSTTSSVHAESFTDSQAESGEWVISADTSTKRCTPEPNECQGSQSGSWASALIAELDQFKNEKEATKNISTEMDMMDDFLEMERLAASPETRNDIDSAETEATAGKISDGENSLEADLDNMTGRVAQLQKRLKTVVTEKAELETALTDTKDYLKASQAQLKETESKLDELQKEIAAVNESKKMLEFQLVGMEVEARSLSANVDSLKAEVQEERKFSTEMAAKCQQLEHELNRKAQEIDIQQAASLNNPLKIKQEDLAVAADKLTECQRTIASLGRQLQSLATLEDFLTDTAVVRNSCAEWKLHANEVYTPRCHSDS